MKKTRLRKYAKLLVQMGIRLRNGQDVEINASIEQPEFVTILADECYRAGAAKVTVNWSYQPLEKVHLMRKSTKVMQTVEVWEEEQMRHQAQTLPCVINLRSDDPDGLKGVNTARLAEACRVRRAVFKPYRDEMLGNYQWCVAAVPGAAWAKKLFPKLRVSQAVEKLWEVILDTSRVTDDPIAAWREHNRELDERCGMLSALYARELHYRADNGTDLRVGLIPASHFCNGSDRTRSGIVFNANIPSEEVFITPMKGKAEGIVYSSMPLSYQGVLIDEFSIRFKDGKAVEVHAKQNEDTLRQIIETDEGAAYLGECAFVPFDSPIRNTGILFYNTLFDENAACHLALGSGYIDSLDNYTEYTLDEIFARGVNDSMNHVDFMIGTKDMDIDIIDKDNKVIPMFRKGSWVI